MASLIEIANRALTKLGVARIMSVDDDNEQARAIKTMYPLVKASELQAYTWNFSIKRAQLAALSEAPAFDYARQFQLPSDCLRLLWAGEYYPGPNLADFQNGPVVDYEVEGNVILTDLAAPLKVRYVSNIEETSQFDPLFAEALSCKLAIELAESMTGSSTNRQLAWEEYGRAIKKAVRADAIERPSEHIADDTWRGALTSTSTAAALRRWSTSSRPFRAPYVADPGRDLSAR
jgi:hypothetical protein